MDRGVERRTIFPVARDYERFLALCDRLKQRFKIEVLAYCLMPNHYHLLLRTAFPNLHAFMKELNGGYSNSFNRRHARIGHLFQGRYTAILVQDDRYALAVAKYIHLNPVRAELADSPEAYRWSSYPAYLGKAPAGIADTSFLLGFFHGSGSRRRLRFRDLTTSPHRVEYDPATVTGGVLAGLAAFVNWARKEKIPRRRPLHMARWRELRRPDASVRASLERRIGALTRDKALRRKLLVYSLKAATPLKLGEIAAMLGVPSANAVTQISRRVERAARTDRKLAGVLIRLNAILRSGQRGMSHVST